MNKREQLLPNDIQGDIPKRINFESVFAMCDIVYLKVPSILQKKVRNELRWRP